MSKSQNWVSVTYLQMAIVKYQCSYLLWFIHDNIFTTEMYIHIINYSVHTIIYIYIYRDYISIDIYIDI